MNEREKYEKMYERPEYHNGCHPGLRHIFDFIAICRKHKANRIIDYGCGPGTAGLRLWRNGFDVTMIDIAKNCLNEEVKKALINSLFNENLKFYNLDISNPLPDKIEAADWGYCTDVMEHFPEVNIDSALSNMMIKTPCVYFSISGISDNCGKLIGEKLHLTVKPWQWWENKLRKYWKSVEVMNKQLPTFIIICKNT